MTICLITASELVGAAVRSNPFAPAVPCHRVIASTGFIGGFLGQWGKKDGPERSNCDTKLDLLAQEGVPFDLNGNLRSRSSIWLGRT